jgi:hypothetical protein
MRDEYEICSVCEWEDDLYQRANPDAGGGANKLSLNVAKQRWKANEDNSKSVGPAQPLP